MTTDKGSVIFALNIKNHTAKIKSNMPAPDDNKTTDANVINNNFLENPFCKYIFKKIDTTNAEDMDEL